MNPISLDLFTLHRVYSPPAVRAGQGFDILSDVGHKIWTSMSICECPCSHKRTSDTPKPLRRRRNIPVHHTRLSLHDLPGIPIGLALHDQPASAAITNGTQSNTGDSSVRSSLI